MPTLLLLRHAKAVPDHPDGDHARPLAERGHREAARTGRFLAGTGLVPARVLVSTARRTRETWDGLAAAHAEAAGTLPAPHFSDALYHAHPDALLSAADDALARLEAEGHTAAGPERPLLLVAHEPGLSQLVRRLTGAAAHFPPGTLACIDASAPRWADVSLAGTPSAARLRWLVPPDALPER
ncbi:MAG: SixA phosphatase family protein [Rubricoccaceae bacterium]